MISEQLIFGNKPVNILGHDHKTINQANQGEAKKVADLVFAIQNEGSIPLHEIGIVTPFRAHAGAVCAALQEKIGVEEAQKILVDTVERFQGQEREAIVYPLAAESDQSTKNGKTFLSDGRRLNVSVTRARSRFYCLATNSLIRNSIESDGSNDLKSFLSWCHKK